jgi:hypothetical protein
MLFLLDTDVSVGRGTKNMKVYIDELILEA